MDYIELNALLNSDASLSDFEPLTTLVQSGFGHFEATQFEVFVLKIFEALGIKGRLTPATGDGGVDIFLNDPNGTIIVQCKKYDSHSTIGSKELREFLGSMTHLKAVHGYFVTTTNYSDQAKAFTLDHNEITLIDREKIEKMFLLSLIPLFQEHAKENRYLFGKDADKIPPDTRKEIEGLYNEFLQELERIIQKSKRDPMFK